MRGGDVLTLNGTGFSNVAHENHILIGNGSCYPIASTFTSVSCRIPFSHHYRHAVSWSNTIDTLCHGGGAQPCVVPPKAGTSFAIYS